MTGEFSMFGANDSEAVFEFGEGDGSDGVGDAALIFASKCVVSLAKCLTRDNSDGGDLGRAWVDDIKIVLEFDPVTIDGKLAKKTAVAAIMSVYGDGYDSFVHMLARSVCKDVEEVSFCPGESRSAVI